MADFSPLVVRYGTVPPMPRSDPNDTARRRVLMALEDARELDSNDGWVAAGKLQSELVGGVNGLRRLRELRDRGYEIDQQQVGTDSFYRLRDPGVVPEIRSCAHSKGKHGGAINQVADPFTGMSLYLCERHRHKLGIKGSARVLGP